MVLHYQLNYRDSNSAKAGVLYIVMKRLYYKVGVWHYNNVGAYEEVCVFIGN